MRARAAALVMGVLAAALLLSPGEARAGAVCSNSPGAGDRVACQVNIGGTSSIAITLSSVSITTTGTNQQGVYAGQNGSGGITISLSDSTISTSGRRSYGVTGFLGPGSASAVTVTGGSISTTGSEGHGVYATGGLAGGIDIDVKGGATIRTTGGSAYGIYGRQSGTGGLSIEMDGGSLTTTGSLAYGLLGWIDGSASEAVVDIDVKGGAVIKTQRTNARGVYAIHQGLGGIDVDTNGATIEAVGTTARAILGWIGTTTSEALIDIDVTGGAVTAQGASSRAVFGANYGLGGVAIGTSGATIETTGDSARAVLGWINNAASEGGIAIAMAGGSVSTEGLSAPGLVGSHEGLGSVTISTNAAAAIRTPFSASGVLGELTADANAAGRIVITHAGSVEARDAGLLAHAPRASGSTFGDGTQTADDAARTAPMIHVTSSGTITVGQSVTDAFIRSEIAGSDGTLSAPESDVFSAITAGNSAALTTALAALSASYDSAWKSAARDLLRKRGAAPAGAAALANQAAEEILELPRAGIRALAINHEEIADHVRNGNSLSSAERTVLAAVLTGGDLAGALAALPNTYTTAWKNEVRRLAALYNAGDIRVDVSGGTIASEGDGVHARYVLEHARNGAITVDVAEDAEITGARAGVFVSGAGTGDLARDDPLGEALGLTADEEDLHQQFVSVHGTVTGGSDAAVHLAGGGTLLVGGTGEILAGSSGRAVWVNHPGRAIIVVHGTVRGGAGAPAAIHLTGGGSVTVGLNGRVEANGADAAIRGDRATTVILHSTSLTDENALNEAGRRVTGAITGAGETVTIAEATPGTTRTTGNVATGRRAADGSIEIVDTSDPSDQGGGGQGGGQPGEPGQPGQPGGPGQPDSERPGAGQLVAFRCGMAADRRCELYEALPSVLLAAARPPAFAKRMTAPRGAKGAWGRIEFERGEWAADKAASVSVGEELGYEFSVAGARAGYDFAAGGRGRLGVSVHLIRNRAEISGVGEIVVNAVGAGASATWTRGDFYADASAQAAWLDAGIDSAASGELENDATGLGVAASWEAGRRVAVLDGAIVLVPRLGFAWARANLGDFTDPVGDPGTKASVEDARSAKWRAGVLLEVPLAGGRLFGSVDVEREIADRTRAKAGGVRLEARVAPTTVQGVLGGAFALNERSTLRLSGRYAAGGSGARRYGGAVSLGVKF